MPRNSLFDKVTRAIGNMLSEEPIADSKNPDNEAMSLEDRHQLKHLLTKVLADLIESPDYTKGKTLVLWIDADQLTFEQYNTESYYAELQSALANECGFTFECIKIKNALPDPEIRATAVGASGRIFVQIVANDQVRTSSTGCAKISIYGDNGSLMQKEYTLLPQDRAIYYIGAGENPKVDGGYRHNDIAIDSSPDSRMIERNQYVSRMHAHIGYSEHIGFYLQVERDGTRLMGKRTRIFRGEEKIECDNPLAPIPLHNGDLIELGKAVVLQFVQQD